MPPKGTPVKEKKERTAQFKSYEAQARLLSALVASLGSHRFNYNDIAKFHGGGVTVSSMEHKFRAARAQAKVITAMVNEGLDPGDHDILVLKQESGKTSCLSQPAAVAVAAVTYFGESTADGLAFQFRNIKKGGDVLKAAAQKGEDLVGAFGAHLKGGARAAGSVPATPSTAKRSRSTKATESGSGATPTSKRRKAVKIEPEAEFDDDEDSPEVDYSELDSTPTKIKPKSQGNAGQLVPRSAWAKPAEKPKRPRLIAIAPAPPRPAVTQPTGPSYTLAPIPGLSSSSNLPNGYTDPATGFGYNVAPPPTRTSASPSVANAPAMGMTSSRRGSAYSSGSYTADSSPATPNLSYLDTTSAQTMHMGNMTMNNAGMGISAATTTPSFNTNMFNSMPSPTPSIQDMTIPQTTASANNVDATTTSFEYEGTFTPAFTGYPASNLYAPIRNPLYTSFDQDEAKLAADIDFGGFEDQGDEEDVWDAGDV
ncbi:hypothetical protein F5144DRAFT_487238 [Chaetomium tenue]|uniref:Uncharacterized protein n=1 Tax=Chaetomium tenue TaxID=1854479 RepID=A0ACB7PIX1_9PEZI|nr:hypothetical protein F5144DRAFT_487238 [Chaetomium globosum]